MKIAIPTRNNIVDDHFGHCEYYTIITIGEDKAIVAQEHFEAPQGCGCKSNISSILKEMEVKVLLAGNMGQGAVDIISSQGIKVIRGCSGMVLNVAKAYLDGHLIDNGIICSHPESVHHNCAH